MIRLLLSVLILLLKIYGFENIDPCTDGDILSNIALNCAGPQVISLATQPTTELKCDIVMNIIQPCMIDKVNETYNATCTEREKHDLIMSFRQTIYDFIKFDVVDCFPERSCSQVESLLYYLPIYCDSDYQSFAKTGICSKLRDGLSCLRYEFNTTTATDTCSDRAVYDLTVNNMRDWPFHICPACAPLNDYYCGLGPVVQECPTDFYCNIHPADRFAVCCPKENPQMSCSSVPSLLRYLPMYCNQEYQSFAASGNCSKFLDTLNCFRNIYNTTVNDTCTNRDVYTTIVAQMQYWPHDICPACVPLDGYFCGRGPNRQDCPPGYYCSIHPADEFAVCCSEDQSMSSTTQGTLTTYKDTSFATTIHISFVTVLTFFTTHILY